MIKKQAGINMKSTKRLPHITALPKTLKNAPRSSGVEQYGGIV
jgi:hypothetical protein